MPSVLSGRLGKMKESAQSIEEDIARKYTFCTIEFYSNIMVQYKAQ